jgi:hypothetical protein
MQYRQQFALNSASFDSCPGDIGVLSVIISELEVGNVQMQIFLADRVVTSDYTTSRIDQKHSIVLV